MTCNEQQRLERFLAARGVFGCDRRSCLETASELLRILRDGENYSYECLTDAMDEAQRDLALMHQKMDRGAA